MKKDIEFNAVEGVTIAVVPAFNETGEQFWNVYLVNHNNFPLDNVLIASKGYGEVDGVELKTSVLRHMFEQVDARSFVLIEPIDPAIFHINNEYWVSYYLAGKIFDKKYVFVPDSITEDNLIEISLLQMKGVLHT